MSKNHKRLKRLKSEKSKVKLKTKRSLDQVSKGFNNTNTSLKVKKILIREQLKEQSETEIFSTRKLSINDLLTRFRHHNSTVREDALKQLKDILIQYPCKSLHSQLYSLLHGIAALSLDKEKNVRRSCFRALSFILGHISTEQLTSLHDIMISYLSCAMTHIDPRVKEDSLFFLDVLMQNCGNIVARDSYKILPNFLTMICRLHNEVRPKARLTTMLNSKNTDVKWKINVLEHLSNMFTSIVNYRNFICMNTQPNNVLFKVKMNKYARYIPIYGNSAIRVCETNFDKDMGSMDDCMKEILPVEEFVKYISLLMPLMFDIWLEVCPNEKIENHADITISNESATLLKNIVVIIQSIMEYIDTLDCDNCRIHRIKQWFRDTFHDAYMKNFLSRFPYGEIKQMVYESGKRQKDFPPIDFTDGCLEQNLGLCQIHIRFTSLFSCNEKLSKSTKIYCESIISYLNDTIKDRSKLFSSLQLIKLLKTLFLKAGPILYANCITLSHTLQLIIEASFYLSQKELSSHLYLTIGDIMLESNLNELHREKIFEKFVVMLPSLLLKSSVDDNVIRMINRIVLRFKEWIREELIVKCDSIIENAKKIDITNSYDDKQSRLMIYNLFYFIDSEIYY